jgi:excisionase family DNA binding protein
MLNMHSATKTMMPLFEPLLTAEEASRHLRMHVKTLLRLARGGEVPGIRMGRYWRFRLSSLDLWLAQQQTGSSQPLS